MSGDFGSQQFQQQQFKHKPSDMANAALDHDTIRQELKMPAKGLLITGLLSVVLVIGGTMGSLVYGTASKDKLVRHLIWNIYGVDVNAEPDRASRNQQTKAAEEDAERRDKQANTVLTLLIGGVIIVALTLCAIYFFAVSGGILMGQLRNYKVCKIACILAMIPVLSPLLVLGIPFGMMGLAKLNKPEVKRAFG